MVLDVAASEMAALVPHDGTVRSRTVMLQRNLSRYFAVYLVPTSQEELARLLGTVERMTRQKAGEIYRAGEQLAEQAGSPTIQAVHIGTVLTELLPAAPTQFGELRFFPQAPTASQVVVETIDLQAFRDTGFVWETLGYLVENELEPDPSALPMAEDAVRILAEGLNAYGLLLLRIGGEHARADFATHLQTRYVRQAGKTIADSASAKGDGPDSPESDTPSKALFTEVGRQSGVEFRHVTSYWLAHFRRYGQIAPTFSGGGVMARDVDGDGWTDLMFCGGQGCRFYRNRHDGTFEDTTESTGLNVAGEARMGLMADFDNDGRQDVFITYARDVNRLFRGLGGGRYEDVTEHTGVDRPGDISGPAVAVDIDNDGLLDLYVGNFGDYLGGRYPSPPNDAINGMPNRLYRNLGNLRFEDITEKSGVGDTGWTQALSHLDFDLDGDQDLYIANDFGRNDLLVNNGDLTFTSQGEASGSSDPFHGMNVALADLNQDRHADIFVTNIWFWDAMERRITEHNSLLLSRAHVDGTVTYDRYANPDFIGHDTGWSWAGAFLDYDNDGDEDLYVVNGFTDYFTFIQYRHHPEIPDQLYPVNNGSDPNSLFRQDPGLRLSWVPESGLELDGLNSRGIAVLDYDRDGDLDVAVSMFHSWARLFRNDSAPPENNWLVIDLVGDPAQGSSLDAIGAQLIARGSDGFYAWRSVTGGEGYLSQSQPEIAIGLGSTHAVDLEILWPGMKRQQVNEVIANQRIRVRQGLPEVEILP